LLPKSTTLSDIERPYGTYTALLMRLSVLTTEILKKIDSCYQLKKCIQFARVLVQERVE